MNDRSNIGTAAPTQSKPLASSSTAHDLTVRGNGAQVIEPERARVEAEADHLRRAGVYVSPDREARVTAATAAAVLGVSPKTLSNWHGTDRRGPRRLCRGPGAPAFYRLAEVLAYRDQLDALAADD